MRLVAYFMREYSYKYEDVMALPSWLFYELIDQAQILKAQDVLSGILQSSYPHMDKNDAQKIIANYEYLANGRKFRDDSDENSDQKARELFGG